MAQRIFWLGSIVLALSAWLVWHTAAPARVDSGALHVPWQEDKAWSVSGLTVRWDAAAQQLSIHDNQSLTWASSPGQPWLGAGYVDADKPVGLRNARNPMRQLELCTATTWTRMTVQQPGTEDAHLRLTGEMDCAQAVRTVRLDMRPLAQGGVHLRWAIEGPIDYSFLEFTRAEEEAFSGFGAQTQALSVKEGRRVLKGRATRTPRADTATTDVRSWDDPLTKRRASGAWPVVMSTASRALLAHGTGSLVLDLQAPQTVRLESWWASGGELNLRADAAPKMLATWLHDLQGGPSGLPTWAQARPIVGTARRGEALDELVNGLQQAGTPVAAVLLEQDGQPEAWQDWPSQRGGAEALPLPNRFPRYGEAWPAVVALPEMTTGWGPQSGLQGSLVAILAAGISGMSVVHSPVGGTLEAEQLWWRSGRSAELFLRWLELNTFTAWLRLHEGAVPQAHFQMFDTVSGRVHFDRMAHLYTALAPYRAQLWREAVENGWPVVRPMWFEFPDDPDAWLGTEDQFMLGPHVLVAPVLQTGTIERHFYLPAGEWTHLWDGRRWSSTGQTLSLASPIGEPIVLIRNTLPDRDVVLETARSLAIGNLLSQ